MRKAKDDSINYSALWPHVPVDAAFRKRVGDTLRKHNLPYSTSILVKVGGLGDFVQMTVVAKALKTKEPNRPVVAVIGGDVSLFDEHPYVDLAVKYDTGYIQRIVKSLAGLTENVFDLRYVSRAYGAWEKTEYYNDNAWHYHYYPASILHVAALGKHVCDIMLSSLGLERYGNCGDVAIIPDTVPQEIKGDYAVVCNTPNRHLGGLKKWLDPEWSRMIKWLRANGIIPVQLGLAEDPLLHPEVLDLRGKTTLRQAAGYLALSHCYIGLEGGLFHLAKAVGTPTVVIFTSTPAVSYAYPDTRVVTAGICEPCLWNLISAEPRCKRGYNVCLNTPPMEKVVEEVAKVLPEKR